MMTAAGLVAPLAATSLSELEQRAALQTRRERKYIVSIDTLTDLVHVLQPDHGVLDIDGRRAFAYDSVYFDSQCRACYRAHIQGRRKRFKARSRLYVDSGRCVFEVKLKGSDGQTVKHALEQPREAHGVLTASAERFLTETLAPIALPLATGVMSACLSTRYDRLTLVSLQRAERLTCDLGLTLVSADGRLGSIARGDVLIETKSATGISHADTVLRRLGQRPLDNLSKYCIGVALHDAGVSTNPWRHTLRRHFQAQSTVGAPARGTR